jgi:hypothetical protein
MAKIQPNLSENTSSSMSVRQTHQISRRESHIFSPTRFLVLLNGTRVGCFWSCVARVLRRMRNRVILAIVLVVVALQFQSGTKKQERNRTDSTFFGVLSCQNLTHVCSGKNSGITASERSVHSGIMYLFCSWWVYPVRFGPIRYRGDWHAVFVLSNHKQLDYAVHRQCVE